jgi:hypothetical protein
MEIAVSVEVEGWRERKPNNRTEKSIKEKKLGF